VYRLKVLGLIENQVTVTSFFYDDNQPIGATARTNAPILKDAFVGLGGPWIPLLACLSADWKGTSIIIDSPTFPAMAPLVYPVADPGAAPVGHMPTQIAASLIKRTAFKGQCGRGRFALPAVPETWVTLSTINHPDAYDAFANNVVQVLDTQVVPFTPILFSRNGSVANPGKMGVAGLLTVDLNPIVGTSRRRKLGVGI
jgi:hypothetical protein